MKLNDVLEQHEAGLAPPTQLASFQDLEYQRKHWAGTRPEYKPKTQYIFKSKKKKKKKEEPDKEEKSGLTIEQYVQKTRDVPPNYLMRSLTPFFYGTKGKEEYKPKKKYIIKPKKKMNEEFFAYTKRQWRTGLITEEIFKNPTPKEYYEIVDREDEEDPLGIPGGARAILVIKTKDLYVASANRLIHQDIINVLKKEGVAIPKTIMWYTDAKYLKHFVCLFGYGKSKNLYLAESYAEEAYDEFFNKYKEFDKILKVKNPSFSIKIPALEKKNEIN
jgi:hypothetical protein